MTPSSQALSNRVDLYRFLGTQDIDAGVDPSGWANTAFAAGVPCSIQPGDPLRYLDEKTGRLMEKTPYDVFFGADYALNAEDKLVGADAQFSGVKFFVFGTANQSGKGGAFQVTTEIRK